VDPFDFPMVQPTRYCTRLDLILLIGDETRRLNEAILIGTPLLCAAPKKGVAKPLNTAKMTRNTKRQIRRSAKRAEDNKNVCFVSPRKKERAAEDEDDDDGDQTRDACCCKKTNCSAAYKCTPDDCAGVLAVAYFRDRFKAMTPDQQMWFISERVKTVNGKKQTYLDTLDEMMAYRNDKRDPPLRPLRNFTDSDKCCRDFFDWVLRISRDKITQPGTGDSKFNPEAPRAGRLRSNSTRPAKVWNLVVQWLLMISAFYLHDPTKAHIYLPFAHRKAVHDLFETEHRRDDEEEVCHASYFNYVWGMDSRITHIRLRKHIRFALCPECVLYMTSRYHAMGDDERAKLKAKEFKHSRFVRAERQSYYDRRTCACKQPQEFFSVIIDGADQSAYSMPHFVLLDKDTAGNGKRIRNHLFGAIVHGRALYGFSYLDNCKHGTNLTIEALHRVLVKEWIRGGKNRLPRVLLLQLDNCSKQNKSQYLIAYLGLLVGWGVFEEVVLSFLPVGHTHEDIDQLFSRIAIYLRKNDARARQEFHEAFCTACKHKKWGDADIPEAVLSNAESMDFCANFSGLVEEQRFTEKDATRQSKKHNRVGLSDFHQFKIYKDEAGQVCMLISEWCATPVWRSNVVLEGKPAVNASGAPVPHFVFMNGVTPPVSILDLMPPMQRKNPDPEDFKTIKKTGEVVNVMQRTLRNGVTAIVQARAVPPAFGADLEECLRLLEDTNEYVYTWDTEIYNAHSVLGPRTPRGAVNAAAVQAELVPSPLDEPQADSEDEPNRAYLEEDDEGYAPEVGQFKEGDVWVVPLIEKDPEKLGWGLCQVKDGPFMEYVDDPNFVNESLEPVVGKFWVVPVMWLMPSQTSTGKDDIAKDVFVANQRKHNQKNRKGWDTPFAASLQSQVQFKKVGAAGYRILEESRACIREAHAAALLRHPLPASLSNAGTPKARKRKPIPQTTVGLDPGENTDNMREKRSMAATDSRKTSRGGNKPAFDEARRQEMYSKLRNEGLAWDKAWDKSLELVVAEYLTQS
jgi:hypothetical protein